jgi:ubiquitin C-terminal hydrolase
VKLPEERKFKYSRKMSLSGFLPKSEYKLEAVIAFKEEGFKLYAKRRHSWYIFDDNTVFKVKLREVLKQNHPHVLFYEKSSLGRSVSFSHEKSK